MTQTTAILLDAYRELNARKLFWITLIMSGVVVAAFALIGINENGLRFVVWDIEVFGINSTIFPPDVFYKSMFLQFGVGLWLTWAAAILALVSTASIFPDFITGGSIDLALSKPIGRWRLFLLKYGSGLLFVALQVGVFSAASFLVIGLRGGVWEPGIFLAIPIVVVFFSYLFCVCVLLGLVTRSTIAALILTIVFWFAVYAVHGTETTLLTFQRMKEQEVQRVESRLARFEEPPESLAADLRREKTVRDRVRFAHRIAIGVKTMLPKTTETIGLLERSLIDPNEFNELSAQRSSRQRGGSVEFDLSFEEVQSEVVGTLRERSVWWIMGTSLLFEGAVLLLGGWIFSRRDF